jgi:hypothetical protein
MNASQVGIKTPAAMQEKSFLPPLKDEAALKRMPIIIIMNSHSRIMYTHISESSLTGTRW